MSSLARRLSKIAAASNNSLDLKAQKVAHSKSLIFEPRIAGTQDFDTIYQICLEGFQELCQLDKRFISYERTIFGEQSKTQDRNQLTTDQNEELNVVLQSFLGLIGARLLLRPAIKAVDWLVRRFRVHEFNTAALLFCFLPYHLNPIFTNVLSILPPRLPAGFKFLQPYTQSLMAPPRSAITNAATLDQAFSSSFNSYVLRIGKARHIYPGYSAFWAAVMTEALAGRLDRARSGRMGIQKQNQEDVLIQILPVVSAGLAMRKVPELQLSCYMLSTVIVSKASLGDALLTGLMREIIENWTTETTYAGLTCLTVIAQQKDGLQLPKAISVEIFRMDGLEERLVEIGEKYRVDKLALHLFQAYLDGIRADSGSNGLEIMKRLLRESLVNGSIIRFVFTLIIRKLQSTTNTAQTMNLAEPISDFLIETTKSQEALSILEQLLQEEGFSKDALELKLQAALPALPAPDSKNTQTTDDVEMEDIEAESDESKFESMLSDISTFTITEDSFLTYSETSKFTPLASTFQIACSSPNNLEKFCDLPILEKATIWTKPLYMSFFLRVASGSFPAPLRATALQVITSALVKTDLMTCDPQIVLVYALISFADPAKGVRLAASRLLTVLRKMYSKVKKQKGKGFELPVFGSNTIYSGRASKNISWLASEEALKFLDTTLVPNLEECVLDNDQISRVLAGAFGVIDEEHPPTPENPLPELKKSLRNSVFSFLSSHIAYTPSLKTRFHLLQILERTFREKSSSRTKLLLPCLKEWKSMDHSDIINRCREEGINEAELERAVLSVVPANDNHGLHALRSIISSDLPLERLSLLRETFNRLQVLWLSMSLEAQKAMGEFLLDISLSTNDSKYTPEQCTRSLDVLKEVKLSADVLSIFLNKITSIKIDLPSQPPSAKRRRTSKSQSPNRNRQSGGLASSLKEITTILEIVDSSKPERYPELLGNLFDVLGFLQQIGIDTQTELAYLQVLVLGSLLAIVSHLKIGSKHKVDPQAVRLEIVVDCIQRTDTPQVHNAALLLIGDLCSIMPELVLHSIMPIFTFMGMWMRKQENDFSTHVIDQTMEQVIPPLVASLRAKQTELISGVSELLLAFISAYKHIPASRRLHLFERLAAKLGPDDFLYAILALLADRYTGDSSLTSFVVELISCFGPEAQLHTFKNYLGLIFNSLQSERSLSQTVMDLGDKKEQSGHDFALGLSKLLPPLLKSRNLSNKINRALRRDDSEAVHIRLLYSENLEQILRLIAIVRKESFQLDLYNEILESLLGLLSMTEFIKSIHEPLKRPDYDLRRLILRSLEARIESHKKDDSGAAALLLSFLDDLSILAAETDNITVKHAAISCIDRIVEKYGKKDPSKVESAAQIIAGGSCLGHKNSQIIVLATLCFTSMVEVLGQQIIPILPSSSDKVIAHWKHSLSQRDIEVQNAVFSFLAAVLTHLPWLISGEILDVILHLTHKSAISDFGAESEESLLEVISFLSKKIDPKELFGAIERTWSDATANGPKSVQLHISLLYKAIEAHPKSAVMRNSQVLSSTFLCVFELRQLFDEQRKVPPALYKETDIDQIEAATINAFISMVYKLNDTTFRPMFSRLIDWTTTTPSATNSRPYTLYALLYRFFSTLKSIVTSYSSLILDPTVTWLKANPPTTPKTTTIWTNLLHTLHSAFENDQDSFWQKPTNFIAISNPLLTGTLTHASSLPHDVITTCITALAQAADSQSHHKSINSDLLTHFRSENIQTRLLAIRCQDHLTEALGEEWLNLLPEMLPFIGEALEDESEVVETECRKWVKRVEEILGESLDDMLQ
ncbi:MAG: snoRNA-binding rRNA-processing protein utp10 [Cirrosporium novae-zelandiae]|nr:MAG: snoRNA-binding rRNA-processing protein utp10 [Cirrosporium novae-zelandiae]